MQPLRSESILLEDSWIIVINKPSGQFTQAALGVPNLQTELIEWLWARDGGSSKPFVGIVHRLDRPTSGVLIYGKTANAVRQLNEQFRARTPTKTYLALVHGQAPASGTAVDWMRKIENVAKAEICSADASQAKQAILHWQRIGGDAEQSLLQVRLETGRMHQIRLQLAVRGLAIVGDPLYGPDALPALSEIDELDEEDMTNEGMCQLQSPLPTTAAMAFPGTQPQMFGLHAAELTVRHPKTAKLLTLRAPAPEAWRERFRWLPDSIFL